MEEVKEASNLKHDIPSSESYINVLQLLAVAQLVEALRYKPEGRGFDS
jgi:hypothetical protein